MAEQLIVRELSNDQWEWYVCDEQGEWLRSDHGDTEAMFEQVPNASLPVTVLVRGQQVIATQVPLDAKQRRHAARLIPYELEDQLSANVDSLHFSYTPTSESDFSVIYAEADFCNATITAFDENGCDLRLAVPDYLMLLRPEDGATLVLDNGIVYGRFSRHWGFAVESELAEIIVQRLADHSALKDKPPAVLWLAAGDEEELELLMAMLPDAWQDIPKERKVADFWTYAAPDSVASELNLRKGRLARQLPLRKWWLQWRLPLYFLAAAVFASLLVNFGLYMSAKSEQKRLVEEMNAAYLEAVPGGRLGDVERFLEARLGGGNKSADLPTNLVYLISKVTKVVAADDAAKLASFNYSGDQRSLQLTMEFSSLAALAEFRNRLQSEGIESDSPRTSAAGEGYQARLKVQEAQQ